MENNGNAIVCAPLFDELHDSPSYAALKKGAVPAQPLLRFAASDTHRSAVHDSLRSSPPPPLLHGTNYQRLYLQTSPHKQRSGAGRSAEFVARYGKKICSQFSDIDGNFACSLACVYVHQSTNLMSGIANFTNRLHYSCFVLNEHDGHHAGAGGERGRECFHIDQSVGEYTNNCDRMACWL